MLFDDPQFEQIFQSHTKLLTVDEGAVLMEPGMTITVIPVVLSGCIRVLRQSEEGAEAFLYHILSGETCALSLTCCSTTRRSAIKAVAEQQTQFYAVELRYVEEWQKYSVWREFVALTFQSRLERLLQVIDDIAFHNMDQRLWTYLLSRFRAQASDVLHVTHDDIAQELNMQREAATRLIRKLKEMGRIETGRNEIRLLKKDELW